jgi:hypothetical protein
VVLCVGVNVKEQCDLETSDWTMYSSMSTKAPRYVLGDMVGCVLGCVGRGGVLMREEYTGTLLVLMGVLFLIASTWASKPPFALAQAHIGSALGTRTKSRTAEATGH